MTWNMAEKNENNLNLEAAAEILGADELFAGEIHEEISEEQVFVGTEDFYTSLTQAVDSIEPSGNADSPVEQPSGLPRRILRTATIVGIVLVSALLLYQVLGHLRGYFAGSGSGPAAQTESAGNDTQAQSPATQSGGSIDASSDEPELTLPASHPVSLKVAQDFYGAAQYDKAYAAYKLLTQNLSDNVPHQRDVIRLRMAMCIERTGDLERASQLFDILSRSHSPVVNMMANYQLGSLQMQKGHFLAARRSLYRALALVNAVDLDRKISLLLQQDGHFQATEAITRQVLSLANKDVELPHGIWKKPQQIDPLGSLDGDQLNRIALSGIDLLKTGSLSPRVKRIDQGDGSVRWSVVCNGASVEELLSRLAAESGLDVVWNSGNASDEEGAEAIVRRRPLNLYLPAANIGQVITAAAGSVGMVARLDDNTTIKVTYPEEYSSLSEHLDLLAEEATSMWQRFLLGFHGDNRTVNVHLILGLLHYVQGRTAESLAEYKMVANRFPNSSLAPHALLSSGKIKSELRDYLGARTYLRQLVEQYPDSQIAEESHMCLADNTLHAGMKSEAAKSYIRVYNLSLSSRTQAAAAIGAGKCYYEMQDYESAIQWMTKYITITGTTEPDDLWLVYYMLGKSYLALEKPVEACRAFEYALGGQLSREQYVETISVLIDARMERNQLVEALGILEDIQVKQFSQADSVKVTLLKSKVLRAMGLFDKAVATLGDKAEYTLDPQLSARISFEIAECHIEQGNWILAEQKLAEVLVAVESGPLACDASMALAEVCMQLGRNAQAVSICQQLLDSDLSEDAGRQTLRLLSRAYSEQKDYDKAALALMGKWK